MDKIVIKFICLYVAVQSGWIEELKVGETDSRFKWDKNRIINRMDKKE